MPSEQDAGQSFVSAFLAASPRLRRIVAGLGFSAADADDVLQEVYLEASQRPGEYRGPEEAQRWLLRATVNRCLLEYRRRSRFRRAAAQVLERRREAGGPGGGPPLHIEEVEAVRRALQSLDGQSSAILVLRYFCDLDSTQIGELLEMPPGTVRSRLHAARLLLAEELGQRGIQP